MTSIETPMHSWATYSEIFSQPGVWRSWSPSLQSQLISIHSWLKEANHNAVWFCGAGTSAFIGESAACYLNSGTSERRFAAVPTTDLVANPNKYLQHSDKLLVVSFGRSGNSSESLGTLDALDVLAPHADRLHITCNAAGALAQRGIKGPGQLRRLVLPKNTDDVGFAMTSSYSTMLLSALACFDVEMKTEVPLLLSKLADVAEGVLNAFKDGNSIAVVSQPERAVFLGSGSLMGAARESALKVLELTAGKVATLWDSSLGFRHGPKAFVNANTRVYVLISSDAHTQRYDLDIAREIRSQYGNASVITIGPRAVGCDLAFDTVGNDCWSVVLYVLFAQYIAMSWSHTMGLNVDNPFLDGNLTRVVSGVTLYPVSA